MRATINTPGAPPSRPGRPDRRPTSRCCFSPRNSCEPRGAAPARSWHAPRAPSALAPRAERAMSWQTVMSAGAAATLPRMTIRPAEDRDSEARAGFLERWHSLRVARLGAREHPLDHPALVTERNGRLVGVLTYVVRGADCEVLTLHVDDRRQRLGTALIAEVKEIARRAGCTRL